MNKYMILVLKLFLIVSCATSSGRKPSGDESLLVHIERSTNPFELFNLHPTAKLTQFDQEAIKLVSKVTGWDWWKLSRYLEENTLEHELTRLTEIEAKSVKKILDSQVIIKNLHKRKGLRIGFGKFSFRIGAKDLKQISIEKLRDIQIYLENDLGKFHVRYGNVDDIRKGALSSFGLESQKGYIIEFSPVAKSSELETALDQAREEVKKLKADLSNQYPDGKYGLKNQVRLLEKSQEIEKLIAYSGTNPKVQKMNFELAKELEIRMQTDGTPTTDIIRKIKKLEVSICSGAYKFQY